MYGSIVARQRSRLREGGVAEVACEGSGVGVAPVMHDQAGALRELAIAVTILAEEVCRAPVASPVAHFDPFIRALGHGFETGVRLSSFRSPRARSSDGCRRQHLAPQKHVAVGHPRHCRNKLA